MRLAAMVVNRGKFTITRIEAQFSYDGMSLVPGHRAARVSSFRSVPQELLPAPGAFPTSGGFAKYGQAGEPAMLGVLTPWDGGIRFESDDVAAKFLKGPHPLVRWTDRWGARWEYRRGEVRQVSDDEPWSP